MAEELLYVVVATPAISRQAPLDEAANALVDGERRSHLVPLRRCGLLRSLLLELARSDYIVVAYFEGSGVRLSLYGVKGRDDVVQAIGLVKMCR